MLFIFSTPVFIRHLWQLKTVVLLHGCLIFAVQLLCAECSISQHNSVKLINMLNLMFQKKQEKIRIWIFVFSLQFSAFIVSPYLRESATNLCFWHFLSIAAILATLTSLKVKRSELLIKSSVVKLIGALKSSGVWLGYLNA